jgi:hypothetical protein
MKKEIGSLAAAAVLAALCAMPAQAATRITTVTNTWNATNGCTVRSVYGYGGYNFNVTIWGVDCPSDPEVTVEKHETWYDWGGLWCEMKNASAGYFVTSNCSSYSIYRN